MYVRAGRPAFARPCVGVHKSTSLMSSSLLLQKCPACLVDQWLPTAFGSCSNSDDPWNIFYNYIFNNLISTQAPLIYYMPHQNITMHPTFRITAIDPIFRTHVVYSIHRTPDISVCAQSLYIEQPDIEYPIYQPLRSGRIWHKVYF